MNEVVHWTLGELIPFGDLVSDVALVVTLPSRDEVENSASSMYGVMRWLLWVGTIVSAIPEIALIVGIFAGLVVGASLGPAAWSTGHGGQTLKTNVQDTLIFFR